MTIYQGDNLDILKEMDDDSIDLIYLDPPFFTQRDFIQFNDKFKDITHYLMWMKERLIEMHRILKSTGSIYLHCDWHASHYLKVEMDKIFNKGIFVSEIVWRRKYQNATITSNTRGFGNNHDVILLYSKSNNYNFNRITIDLEVDAKKYQKDEGGYFKTSPSGNYSETSLNKMVEDGKAYETSGGNIRKKTYLQLKNGILIDTVPVDNIWLDIPNMMHTPKKERLGYPTQKPEALLERIIKASSNEGDVVLDPFCGCGTTAAVADRFKRHYIGIDISPIAIELCNKRLGIDHGTEIQTIHSTGIEEEDSRRFNHTRREKKKA